ncbi:LysR family transcriptional regulator [Marinomonas atlantica]|uniref:LysR family transcriptional regulator n=1 Tax=Marinomonas atlantica TaxID=1806668 RepID=UPI00082AEFDF|nr:LysR family transcriptional regulator [Marinomonas atlantica]
MLDVKHYEMILELDRCGSLKAAASSIGITQPAATYRLNEIEKRLTVKIYYSVGRRLLLTEAGKRLLQDAEKIIHITKRAEEDAIVISRSEQYIKWGISGYDKIEDLLSEIPSEISNRLDICRFSSDYILKSLLEGKVDFIITNSPTKSKEINSELILTDKLRFIANKENDIFKTKKISVEEISNKPYITYSRYYQPEMEFEKIFRPSGHTPNSIREIDSVSSILKIVSNNKEYISCLSEWTLNNSNIFYNVINDEDLSIDCNWYFLYREKTSFKGEIEIIKSVFKKKFNREN